MKGGDVIVVVGSDQSLHELAKVGARHAAADASAAIPDVELREAIAAAETDAVSSLHPDGVSGRLQRFWKTPVNDPWSPAPGPIFSESPMPDTLLSPST